MRIDKDSYGTIARAWAVSGVFIAALFLIFGASPVIWILTFFAVVFMVFVTLFHRVPVRHTVGGESTICSVADGKVIIVEKAFEKEYLKRECMQVSIYMNFFDVHANFWPMDGKITYYKYHPGDYLLAFHPKASEKNEHSSTVISGTKGELLFKQIAGTFARRIVCYSKEGMDVKAGDQCGIIKFGSRIDMYLPLDADIKVKVGDLTRASETVIAELH